MHLSFQTHDVNLNLFTPNVLTFLNPHAFEREQVKPELILACFFFHGTGTYKSLHMSDSALFP
jgi:hypothetical protein